MRRQFLNLAPLDRGNGTCHQSPFLGTVGNHRHLVQIRHIFLQNHPNRIPRRGTEIHFLGLVAHKREHKRSLFHRQRQAEHPVHVRGRPYRRTIQSHGHPRHRYFLTIRDFSQDNFPFLRFGRECRKDDKFIHQLVSQPGSLQYFTQHHVQTSILEIHIQAVITIQTVIIIHHRITGLFMNLGKNFLETQLAPRDGHRLLG